MHLFKSTFPSLTHYCCPQDVTSPRLENTEPVSTIFFTSSSAIPLTPTHLFSPLLIPRPQPPILPPQDNKEKRKEVKAITLTPPTLRPSPLIPLNLPKLSHSYLAPLPTRIFSNSSSLPLLL